MPATPTTTTPAPATPAAARSRRLARVVSVAGAVLATATIWVLAVPVGGAHLDVRLGAHAATQHIGLAAIVTVSVLAGLAGWALLAALERSTARAARAWAAFAVLALLISLAGPLTGKTSTTTLLVLAGMHLSAGGVLIPALARTSARR